MFPNQLFFLLTDLLSWIWKDRHDVCSPYLFIFIAYFSDSILVQALLAIYLLHLVVIELSIFSADMTPLSH